MKQENRTEKYEQKNRKKYVDVWMVGLNDDKTHIQWLRKIKLNGKGTKIL